VTGSSRGIGREIAGTLAEKGARIVVHYRSNREAAEETLTPLQGVNGAHTPPSAVKRYYEEETEH
jgi:NAD(P)-dependent dehydrogenase (short-subunit alcohol dehydrogenase family)